MGQTKRFLEGMYEEQDNISVENCRKVFAEIEKSKLELSNTTETLLQWLKLLLEYTNSDSSLKYVISNKF